MSELGINTHKIEVTLPFISSSSARPRHSDFLASSPLPKTYASGSFNSSTIYK